MEDAVEDSGMESDVILDAVEDIAVSAEVELLWISLIEQYNVAAVCRIVITFKNIIFRLD